MVTFLEKKDKSAVIIVAALLFVGIPAVTAAPVMPWEFSATGPAHVDWSTAAVGDVVAVGVIEGSRCILPDLEGWSSVAPRAPPKWLSLRILASCVVVVSGKWEGDLHEGPGDVVAPVEAWLAGGGRTPQDEQGLPRGESMPFTTASTCETSYQHVFMYGHGGTSDSLTHKNGKIAFCYDGTNAWTTEIWGNCEGTSQWYLYWDWVVDACRLDAYDQGPTWFTYREGSGDYHCSPTNVEPCSNGSGYFHTLYDKEYGRGDGDSDCAFRITGTYVAGVDHEVLQGCT